MQFPHSCGYDTPRQKPYTHTYGAGREKKQKENSQRSVGKVNNQPSILEYHVASVDDRSAPDASTFLLGGSDVKKPRTTQSLSSLAGSGRRRSPAELQLGEFHSVRGGGVIRRHVRKIREGKQALGRCGLHSTVGANANANVLSCGVESALEGTVGSISSSGVTLDEGFGSDAY